MKYSLIKPHRNVVTLADCNALLDSEWHEIRPAALLLMVDMAKRLATEHMDSDERKRWMMK